VVTASAGGGNAFGQKEIQALWAHGPEAVSAYQSIGWFYAASSGQISILHQLKGACGVLVADAAGGLDALAQARRLIARGSAAVLTGGTEAPLSPYALACQLSQPGLSRSGTYRPFAGDGFLPGEGGAMLVLEAAERAAARAARVYASVAGAASTHDAWHAVDPAPSHTQYARAMREAITRSGVTPDDIDVVFADAAGSPELDRQEAAAITEVFGRRVPVTAPKSMTGRLCSGGGALDLAWAALALHHDTIPPTVDPPDGDLDLVGQARTAAGLRAALVLARGAGGFNSAVVLQKSPCS
jgi:3-oxoacyl-(acyl-carrier-protein) synthase